MPETGNVVIENKHLSEAILESIIGKHGVSPAAKQSLASRISDLLKETDNAAPMVLKLNPKHQYKVISFFSSLLFKSSSSMANLTFYLGLAGIGVALDFW